MVLTDLVYIDSTGYHFASYPDFLTWLQDQYRGIYGSDIYIEPDSQDGQFLAVLAKAFYDTAALGGATYNSFSPATSQGVGLSRVVKINGVKRRDATHSTADVLITGSAGTNIIGGIIKDTLEQKWNIPDTLIPMGGTITVTATAQDPGALTAGANTLTTIFTPTRGWQSVTNAAQATPGVAVETDAELRTRQSQSTADPSLTVLEGTYGGVANLDGVTNVKVYENDTGSTDGNGIPAHSIAPVVEGGDAQTIANEVALHKTPGVGTYGTTSETVYDSHGMPLTIKFSRPILATIGVEITLTSNTAWSSDYETLIENAIADYINSLGISGQGGEVIYSKLFAPAYLNGTLPGQSYDITTLQISKNGGMSGTSNLVIDWNELPVCDPTVDVVIIVT